MAFYFIANDVILGNYDVMMYYSKSVRFMWDTNSQKNHERNLFREKVKLLLFQHQFKSTQPVLLKFIRFWGFR